MTVEGRSPTPTCQGFAAHVAFAWRLVQDAFWAVNAARFSVLAVLLAGILVVLVPQGRETLVIITEEASAGPGYPVLRFLCFVVLLAAVAWYCARQILNTWTRALPPDPCRPARFADRETRLHWWRDHLPRMLGAAAFVIVLVGLTVAYARSGAQWWAENSRGWCWFFGETAIAGGLFYLFVAYRRPVMNGLAGQLNKSCRAAPRAVAAFVSLPPTPRAAEADAAHELAGGSRRTLFLLRLAAVVGVLLLLLGAWRPVWIATEWGGAAAMFFLAAAAWIPHGTYVTYKGSRWGLPLLGMLVVVAVVSSAWKHSLSVRTVAAETADARPNLPAAFEAWKTAAPAGARPIVVATAGGGSRAAYWTATVLGRLEDCRPGFSDRVFAISGVSGGSLGAAVFAALASASAKSTETDAKLCPGSWTAVAAGPARREPACVLADGSTANGFEACGQRVLGQDFLAANLANALMPGIFRSFFPLSLDFVPDHAAALEQGWEAAWAKTLPCPEANPTCRREGLFAARTAALRRAAERPWVPLLLLNGTSVKTGLRLIWSDFRLDAKVGDEARPAGGLQAKMQAVDLRARMDKDVPLSTAANMSARFPYLEPAGGLDGPDGRWDRIVDGGYYENFGATTAEELVRQLHELDKTIKPIVIQIASDPEVGAPERAAEPGRFLSALLDPIAAFFAAREARGLYATRTLRDLAGDDYFRFDLCEPPNSEDDKHQRSRPTLSWAMSRLGLAQIRQHLLRPPPESNAASRCGNWEELGRLVGLVGP